MPKYLNRPPKAGDTLECTHAERHTTLGKSYKVYSDIHATNGLYFLYDNGENSRGLNVDPGNMYWKVLAPTLNFNPIYKGTL